MPTDSPEDNKAYCKAYYERLKRDPLKMAERQAKKAAAQRLRRAMKQESACDFSPEPVTSPVTSAPEDPLARIHREYKAECEALGYDVDGNREAVLEAIKEKLADPKLRLSPPRRMLHGSPEDEA